MRNDKFHDTTRNSPAFRLPCTGIIPVPTDSKYPIARMNTESIQVALWKYCFKHTGSFIHDGSENSKGLLTSGCLSMKDVALPLPLQWRKLLRANLSLHWWCKLLGANLSLHWRGLLSPNLSLHRRRAPNLPLHRLLLIPNRWLQGWRRLRRRGGLRWLHVSLSLQLLCNSSTLLLDPALKQVICQCRRTKRN